MLNVNQLNGFGASSQGMPLYDAIVSAGLTSGLQFCLDAGDASSYSSGQKWLDLSGNGYDFFRGADGTSSTDDPTFNGSVNGLSSEEYWSFDGGDFFDYDAAEETFMNNLHLDNAVLSAVCGFRTGGTLGGAIFGTRAVDPGIEWQAGAGGHILSVRYSGGAALLKTADAALSTSTNYHVGVSFDEAVASGAFLYRNGAFDPVSASNTWDPTYTTPGGTSGQFTLGGSGGSPGFASGYRMHYLAVWTVALTEANMNTLFNLMRGRMGL